MISKRPCPYTGVVNFFTSTDPFLAVGSVTAKGKRPRYEWHCYLDDPVEGSAPDIGAAEAALRRALADRRAHV